MSSAISLLWEAPLGCASRWLFLCVRFVLRRLANVKLRRQGESLDWQLLSGDLLAKWFAVPVIMTEGPRWNTHAAIARVGPIDVDQTLWIGVPDQEGSARVWTIVIYTFPGHVIERVLTPADAAGDGDGWIRLSVTQGSYTLIVRYYDPAKESMLPEVRVDGRAGVVPVAVPAGANDFYEHLSSRHSLFYTFLHFHAYAALRNRRWLPASMVREIYLPVGNPETSFRYGALAPGEALRVELSDNLLEACDVYITFYDLASFPLSFQTLTKSTHQWSGLSNRRTYLIRINSDVDSTPELRPDDLRITVQPGSSAAERRGVQTLRPS